MKIKSLFIAVAILICACLIPLTSYADSEFQDYMPTAVLVTGGNNIPLMISWINPVASTLNDVKVYNITGGVPVDISEQEINNLSDNSDVKLRPIPGIRNYIKDTGTEKTYKIVCSFSDGKETEYFTSGVSGYIQFQSAATGWQTDTGSAGDGTPSWGGNNPSSLNLDNKVLTPGGNPSVRFTSHAFINHNRSGWAYYKLFANPQLFGTGPLSPRETYIFSGYVKAKNADVVAVENSLGDSFAGWEKALGVDFYSSGWHPNTNLVPYGTYDWQPFSFEMTPDSSIVSQTFSPMLTFDSVAVEYVWFGDLSFTLKGGGGTNFLTNGDFSADKNKVPSNVTNLQMNGTILSWDNPANTQNFETTNVYVKQGSSLIQVAHLPSSVKSLSFKDIDDSIDSFVVMTCSTLGLESSGAELIPPYLATPAALFKDSEQLQKIETAGNYSIKTNIKNNTMGDSFNTTLFGVLYNNDKIMDICGNSLVIDEGSAMGNSFNFTIADIKESDNYKIEVFLWDDINNMTILNPFTTFIQK